MTNLVRFSVAALGGLVGLLLSLPLVLVAIPFWLVHGLGSLFQDLFARFRAAAVPWTNMVVFDPEIGWRPKGNLDLTVRGERTARVTTGADGWRGKQDLDEAEVVVFGDSFAFGHGTDDRAFFADRVAGARVKAIGADGYNLVQEFQWMQRLGRHLEGKLIVWLVYYGNDLYDNLTPHLFGYRQPFLRTDPEGEEWEIVTEHLREAPWRGPKNQGHVQALSEICCDTYAADRAFEATAAIVGWGRDLLAELGADLVVVGHPDPVQVVPERAGRLERFAPDPGSFDPLSPDTRLARICRDLGVRFESLTPRLVSSDFLFTDVHWTPAGNVTMAELVAELAAERREPAKVAAPGPDWEDGT